MRGQHVFGCGSVWGRSWSESGLWPSRYRPCGSMLGRFGCVHGRCGADPGPPRGRPTVDVGVDLRSIWHWCGNRVGSVWGHQSKPMGPRWVDIVSSRRSAVNMGRVMAELPLGSCKALLWHRSGPHLAESGPSFLVDLMCAPGPAPPRPPWWGRRALLLQAAAPRRRAAGPRGGRPPRGVEAPLRREQLPALHRREPRGRGRATDKRGRRRAEAEPSRGPAQARAEPAAAFFA